MEQNRKIECRGGRGLSQPLLVPLDYLDHFPILSMSANPSHSTMEMVSSLYYRDVVVNFEFSGPFLKKVETKYLFT